MNLLEGFWWGKFLVCGLRVANDVSAFIRPNRFGESRYFIMIMEFIEGEETIFVFSVMPFTANS